MELDLEMLAILLQRRHGCLREIQKLTNEMQEAVSRQDQVSFSLLLHMRAEEIAKYDVIKEELWSQAKKGREAREGLKRLLRIDPDEVNDIADPMERKIFEIRKKSKELILDIQRQDQLLNRRVTGRR